MDQNYTGIVAEIKRVEKIEKADNIHIAYVLGEPVIVSKEWDVGMIGLFFPTDTQLSHEFVSNNNLYRDSEQNVNKEKKGFFESNRRVRAQPFLGVKSCGFFCQLDSLDFTGSTEEYKLGDKIATLNGVEIAKKYVNEKTRRAIGNSGTKKAKKNQTPLFVEHVDTDQFKYNIHTIPKGALISIQAKKHGTSFRSAHTKVIHDLPKWKQMINKLIPIFPTESWDFVTGTRRVVLKNEDTNKDGFHGSESYRFEVTEALKPFLSKGMTVYGEILGYVNGKPIMGTHNTEKLKDKAFTKKYGKEMVYRYGNNEGQYSFMIYRITLTTDDGTCVDFTQPQLVQWCEDRGLTPALDVIEPFVYDGDQDKLVELVDMLTERPDVLCEDYTDPTHISEGVIIRVDHTGTRPKFYKSKSFPFKVLEGIFKEDNVDVEDAS